LYAGRFCQAGGLDNRLAVWGYQRKVTHRAARHEHHALADPVIASVEKYGDVAHVNTKASNAPSVPMMPTAQSQTIT
jgi:hypothetical protein